MSATVLSASSPPLPPPWRSDPRSLTTTLAPSFAKSSACSRPMPPPAPVMIATLPSSMPMASAAMAVGPQVVDDDLGALFREEQRVLASDAAACAGDDRDLAVEHAHGLSLLQKWTRFLAHVQPWRSARWRAARAVSRSLRSLSNCTPIPGMRRPHRTRP